METTNLGPLIEKSSAGDASAFEALYKILVPKVFGYIEYRLRIRDVARECTQDVFIALYEALPRFQYQSDEQFYSYLFTITKRVLLKQYYNKHTVASAQRVAEEGDHFPDRPNQYETIDSVTRALATLDAVSREIIVLHHWSRYTFPEIAALIGMTESAVRVRHHRAQKQIATLLTTTPV